MAVDRAAASGGLSANIADLQRVVILRDAGRMSAADAATAPEWSVRGMAAASFLVYSL